MSLLRVENLAIDFGRHRRPAVRGISFDLDAGERVGIIGESGSGKSVTALAVMGLLPENAHVSGSITFRDHQVVGAGDRAMSKLRGDAMSMVFQEPMTALDPTMTIGRQVAEVVRLHAGAAPGQARQRVVAILGEVGLSSPARAADAYPHQLSGGQRQRVLIAMALVNAPALVICDEPTTALDVTVQARVLALLDEQLTKNHSACLFISHDLAVVSQVCTRLLVMWQGQLVESGPMAEVLAHPSHGYTRGLIATARLADVAPGIRLPVVEDYWTPDSDGATLAATPGTSATTTGTWATPGTSVTSQGPASEGVRAP